MKKIFFTAVLLALIAAVACSGAVYASDAQTNVTSSRCADDAHVWTSQVYVDEDECEICGLVRSDFALDLVIDISFGETDTELYVKAEPTDTVLKLKDSVAQSLGISVELQVMTLGEAVMENGRTLMEYGLSDGDVIGVGSVCGDDGHTWTDATCKTPKTCATCGQTEGDVSGHTWADATCTSPKTCVNCGETEGLSSGHKYSSADCVSPKVCTVCGATYGEPLGHQYDGDCDGECNRCASERRSTACIDYNEDRVCDVCGDEIAPEGALVDIVGAVLISVAVLALGALVVVFAVKKKK